MPAAIVETLSLAIRKVMADPQTTKRYDDNGLHPATLAPAEYVAFLKRDSLTWGEVVRRGNIKIDD